MHHHPRLCPLHHCQGGGARLAGGLGGGGLGRGLGRVGCWGAGELPGLLGGLSHVAVRGGEEVVAQGLAGGARNPEVVGAAPEGWWRAW